MPLDPEIVQSAAPHGSMMQYALIYAPPDKRERVTAILALCREISGIGLRASEFTLGQIKLQWWRDELARLGEGRGQHPIVRALRETGAWANLKPEYVDKLMDGASMDLMRTSFLSFEELALYCYRTTGVRHILMAEALSGEDRPADHATLAFARHLGEGIGIAEILRNLGDDTVHDRNYLPTRELAEVGLDSGSLRSKPDALVSVLRAANARATAALGQAVRCLPEDQMEAQRSQLVLGGLYGRLLRALERAGFETMHQRVGLGPWSKWWISWRAARTKHTTEE